MSEVYGAVTGLQDRFLTDSPDVSLFYPNVTVDQPNHIENYVLPFDTIDNRICTIPYKGDFISDISIKITLPGLVNTNDNFWTFGGTPPPGYASFYSISRQNSPLMQITPSNFDVNQINLFQNKVSPYVSNVAAGPDFSLFTVSNSNYIFVAGNNSSGQLGTGNTSNVTSMISYFPPFNIPVAKIACGKSHTAILDSSGTIWTCGDNSKGQLGNGIVGQVLPVTSFIPVATGTFLDVQCTNYATLILVSGGKVAKTGTNVYGELGSDTSAYYSFVYVTDSGFPSVVSNVACGPDFTLIATSSSIYSSGNNSSGQLGQGSFSSFIFGFATVSTDSTGYTSGFTYPVRLMAGNGYSSITDSTKRYIWFSGIIGINSLKYNTHIYVNSSKSFFGTNASFSNVYNNLTTLSITFDVLPPSIITYNTNSLNYNVPTLNYLSTTIYPVFSF